jgi:hypothetical protein
MKYILSRKEWEKIQTLLDKIGVLVDTIYVESYEQFRTGDIKYDESRTKIYGLAKELQDKVNNLKDLTS